MKTFLAYASSLFLLIPMIILMCVVAFDALEYEATGECRYCVLLPKIRPALQYQPSEEIQDVRFAYEKD